MRRLRYPADEFGRRVSRIRKRMHHHEMDALLIFSAPGSMRYEQRGHVLYVSGYEPYFGDTMVILPSEKNLDPVLQVDSADYFPRECTWIQNIVRGQDPSTTVEEYMAEVASKTLRIGVVGRGSTPARLSDFIRRSHHGCEVLDASEILEAERSTKSLYEIDQIRKASTIAEIGFEAALDYAKPGLTEAAVIAEVERACRLAGSEGFPHHTMVTSGKHQNHLEWWWYCGRRKFRKGDPWNLDFGTMFNGYCCDIARSFCVGKPAKRHVDVYGRLAEAEEIARQAMVPGAMASDVNKAVTAALSKDFDDDFSGIGHGVGLEVHEWPFVGYEYIKNDPVYADQKLKENMILSVEPSVYSKDFGYLQIEDEFIVTRNGGRPLSAISKGLWH